MDIKKIVKSSPAFIVPAIINLLSLLVLTRVLSLEDFGQLSLALITIEFVHGILFQWLISAMMRFYKSDNNTSSVVTGVQFLLVVCTLLLGFLAVINFSGIELFKLNTTITNLIVFAVIGRGVAIYIQDYLRISLPNLKKYTIVSLLSSSCYYLPALVYVLLFDDVTIPKILLSQVAGIYLFLFVYLLVNLKQVLKTRLNSMFPADWYKSFLLYGAPLIVVFLASSMFIRIDRFIIENNVGLKQLGSYSAAFSLSNLAISSFFMILTLPTYPEIIRKINDGDTSAARQIYDNNGNIILTIGIPILFTCTILNTFICNIFFADKGSEIALIFPFVALGTFLYNFKLHYFDQVFQFGKKTTVYMSLGLVVGLSHLALSYQLSKGWGAKGVAFSGILLNFLSIIFIYYYSKSFFAIRFSRNAFIGILAGGVILSCYWLL